MIFLLFLLQQLRLVMMLLLLILRVLLLFLYIGVVVVVNVASAVVFVVVVVVVHDIYFDADVACLLHFYVDDVDVPTNDSVFLCIFMNLYFQMNTFVKYPIRSRKSVLI